MKSLDSLQVKAIAIYLYDISHHLSKQSGGKQKTGSIETKQTHSILDFHTIVYEEIKSLAMYALMFLESLIGGSLSPLIVQILQVVVLQFNLLLSLANDTLDTCKRSLRHVLSEVRKVFAN